MCGQQECVPQACDSSQIFCPQIAVRCEQGFVPVTTRPECGCPTTTCKQCPQVRCPAVLCSADSVAQQNFDENGCPGCQTCVKKQPCPLLGCPPPSNDLICRATQVRVNISAGVTAEGCPTGCARSVCCERPVCPQVACAPDTELIVTESNDVRGCPSCPKQECVKKTMECRNVFCPLGFPHCEPPKVLKTTRSVDPTGCPGCPSYECVDPATCKADACPPAARPQCPPGSQPIEVKRRVAESCDQVCPAWECSQVCPEIDCAAPEIQRVCPAGTKPLTVGVELANGCRGCPRVTCVRDVCALKPRICAFIGTRCPEGTVAVTTTAQDDDGCDMCPQTTCEKKPTECPAVACRLIALACKPGYHAVSVRDFDDSGCPAGCDKQVCVADTCPKVACDLPTCAGRKRVTQTFDKNNCPMCDNVECVDTQCPRIRCADVLPSCEEGYVPERVEEDADDTCPSCPVYRCTKKADCPKPAFACAEIGCAEDQVTKFDRDANGCERGCPKCVPKCATSCEDESNARKMCMSGAPQARIIDRASQCCTWGCIGDDAIQKDVPVDGSSAATSVLAVVAVVMSVAVAMF